jgi:hypothetical protein
MGCELGIYIATEAIGHGEGTRFTGRSGAASSIGVRLFRATSPTLKRFEHPIHYFKHR